VVHGRAEWAIYERAIRILANITADSTGIDPGEYKSSVNKPRSECWAEWALERASRLEDE
jgi:hypothetical protein